ncbi:hypothetical protein D3C86_1804610 [compost metagenome]
MIKSFLLQIRNFFQDLFIRKGFPADFIVQAKTAIGTNVVAFIAQVHRGKKLNGLPEAFLGQLMTQLCHLLQIRFSRR